MSFDPVGNWQVRDQMFFSQRIHVHDEIFQNPFIVQKNRKK